MHVLLKFNIHLIFALFAGGVVSRGLYTSPEAGQNLFVIQAASKME